MRQPNHQQLLSSGTRLNEWVVGAPIAVGPFAILYEGCGTHVAEPVVIKEYFPAAVAQRLDGRLAVLDAPGAADRYSAALERFIVQARLLRGVTEHKAPPHLAAVRSVIKANNTAYLVMSRAAGTPLRETARLDGAAAEALVRRLGAALAPAHEAGVVHGHIVPANILIDDTGAPTLIGFGSVRFDTGDEGDLTPFTPPYAALEQYVAAYPLGPWTDIYALGVIVHQAVTGLTPPEVIGRTGSPRNRKLVPADWPDLPPGLLAAIDAALQIAPQQRPQSVGAWLALLDGDAPTVAAPAIEPAAPPEATTPSATEFAALLPSLQPLRPAIQLPAVVAVRDGPSPLDRIERQLAIVARHARRHPKPVAVGAAVLATAAASLALIPTQPVGSTATPRLAAAAVAAAPDAEQAGRLAIARDRHGVIVRHADTQARRALEDLAAARAATRTLPATAATTLLARADATQAGVEAGMGQLNATTGALGTAGDGATVARLLEAAAGAGAAIDREQRSAAQLRADATQAAAAAQSAADGAKRDEARAALDRALTEARTVQTQAAGAIAPASPLRARLGEAERSLARHAATAANAEASRSTLLRAARGVAATRKQLTALIAEAKAPAPTTVASPTVAAAATTADPAVARAVRAAGRAYDDVNREYLGLRSRIERAYRQRPANDPAVAAAYAAAGDVYRGLLDLAPRRDAVGAAPTAVEAERRLSDLRAALKPLDKRLDSARRGLSL